RIDEIIVFHKLAKEEIMTIVDLMLRRLREQMAQHGVTIELTPEAKELLGEGSTILVGRKLNDEGEPGEEVDITFIPGEVTPEQVTVPPDEPKLPGDED